MFAVLLFVYAVLYPLAHVFDVLVVDIAHLHLFVQLFGMLTCLQIPGLSFLFIQISQRRLIVIVECLG